MTKTKFAPPMFFSVEEKDTSLIVRNNSVYNAFSDNPEECEFTLNGSPIQDASFINCIKSNQDIGELGENYAHFMSNGATVFYISHKQKEYKLKRGELNRIERQRAAVENNLRIKNELKQAYADTTPMLDIKRIQYSSSKSVTKKMIKLLEYCWNQTQKGVESHVIRDEFVIKFADILVNAPEIAEYDYEDKYNERQIFWSHFPDSWKIIFCHQYNYSGGLRTPQEIKMTPIPEF